MQKRQNIPTDREFQKLASKVNGAIIKNDGLIGDQKEQVEKLIELEKKFKKNILKYQQSTEIYKKFINFIVTENGNILSAKPYFREKSTVFNSKITKAMKKNDVKALMQFDINYQLIDFIVKNWKGNLPERAKKYHKEFLSTRKILIENNLPLAINRAKLFYRKTPKSSLNLLDFIDICTYGLISGIDKYVGEYSKVWRSVCIGRMVGYMIEEYSKTFLKMYPTDKKILYRANSLKYRMKIEDLAELTKAVNESFIKDKQEGKSIPTLPISEVHVRTLLNGSSYISADVRSDEEEGAGYTVYENTADNEASVEDGVINKDLISKLSIALKNLTLMEMKIIRLKGVSL